MSSLQPFTAYHGIREWKHLSADALENFAFDTKQVNPEGIHFGSLKQAVMRACGGPVLEIQVHADRLPASGFKRLKDRPGGWAKSLKRLAREGVGLVTYLNRYEGVTNDALDRIMEIGSDRFDRMSDSEARQKVPGLEDSYIVIDPSLISILRVIPGSEAKHILEKLSSAQQETPSEAPGAKL